jgi:predicted O-methyltransferase YrrM
MQEIRHVPMAETGWIAHLIYFPPSLRGFVNKFTVFSTWVDHLPFAYDLVHDLRPKVIVELGTQGGMSYFCFCQAVREHDVASRCYAVDTWQGDDHTGAYDDAVYSAVAAHNDANYKDFSELLRIRFEEAVGRFEDGTIELLHIDGFHTYEAVRQDFETWYPKVAPGGVVLFHDIAARMMDFGAWKYWSELTERHRTFTFRHGFGLGVLEKPGAAGARGPLVEMLFSGDPATEAKLRALYIHAAKHVDLLRYGAALEQLKARVREKRAAKGQ